MEVEKKQSTSLCHVAIATLSAFGLVAITAIITVVVARSYFANDLCTAALTFDADQSNRLSFSQETEWDTTRRVHFDEKGVTLMLTESADRCYVMPINRANEKRTLVLVHEPLSEEMLDHIAGPDGVHFCGDSPAYLLKDVHTLEASRQKREAAANGTAPAAPAPTKASSSSSDNEHLAKPTLAKEVAPGSERASGLNLEYDQRNPRCEDLVLDCGKDGAIGQTQNCYTWINGVILMKQECVDTNKFKIYMSKPPGRILKIAQREWKTCILRRQQGQRC